MLNFRGYLITGPSLSSESGGHPMVTGTMRLKTAKPLVNSLSDDRRPSMDVYTIPRELPAPEISFDEMCKGRFKTFNYPLS